MTGQHFNVAIIGAGPAGMAAAISTSNAGLKTIVLDDQNSFGGQVYRNISKNESLRSSIESQYLGNEYFEGHILAKEFTKCNAEHLSNCIVWQITSSHEIAILTNEKVTLITADYIIIATGAIERPMPILGWTLSGVMSVGGVQTLLKTSAVAAENSVFIGCGPLLYLTAWQYIKAGISIRAVVDTTRLYHWRAAIGFLFLALLQPRMLFLGLKWLNQIKNNTFLIKGIREVEVIGNDHAEGVEITLLSGQKQIIKATNIFLHQGVIPNINLSMASGLDHEWNKIAHCWQPIINSKGKTSDERIYMAGDGIAIAGAKSAVIQGRLVADQIIYKVTKGNFRTLTSRILDRINMFYRRSNRPFLDRLYLPSKEFRLPQKDNIIVCRCENITKNEVISALKIGVAGPNQLKAFCRVGMGRCQGRTCGLIVQELIAIYNNQSMYKTGYFRIRPPVKPITLAELASLEGPWPN